MMETDRSYLDRIARVTPVKKPTHTGLVLVTRSPVLFTHLDQDDTGDGNRPPLSGPDSPGDHGEETDSHHSWGGGSGR